MQEQEYFKNALSNFTHEAASGGAIRHFVDLGYTVKQIVGQLDFPTPYERVQKTVWEYLLDTGVVLLSEPAGGQPREKSVFVRDYDKYGRTSLRLVHPKTDGIKPIEWKESSFCTGKDGTLSAFLEKQCAKNGEEASYISCRFGLQNRKSPHGFLETLQILNEVQRDYILGLPWPQGICYHRLTKQMREIMSRLYDDKKYCGNCYFLKTEEKITLVSN